MLDRIAVTVIGGYLGAGKTTLINHLLRDADERIAVLVNDFGDINVDVDLIDSKTDDTIELSNGCICCSIVDGFAEALDRIVAMEPRPTRLVIETSGVADPAQVAAYGHGPGLALDAVIVLVDAETIRTLIDDRYLGQTVRQHLDSADVLVVNKADLVDADELEATMTWLSHGWPDAFVLATTGARVGAEVLFGRVSTIDPASPAEDASADDDAADHRHGHDHGLAHPFSTETLRIDEPMTADEVDALMDTLSDQTVRAKGLVHVTDAVEPYVLQRVGRRWTLRPSGRPWPRTPPVTEIVVIAARGDTPV